MAREEEGGRVLPPWLITEIRTELDELLRNGQAILWDTDAELLWDRDDSSAHDPVVRSIMKMSPVHDYDQWFTPFGETTDEEVDVLDDNEIAERVLAGQEWLLFKARLSTRPEIGEIVEVSKIVDGDESFVADVWAVAHGDPADPEVSWVAEVAGVQQVYATASAAPDGPVRREKCTCCRSRIGGPGDVQALMHSFVFPPAFDRVPTGNTPDIQALVKTALERSDHFAGADLTYAGVHHGMDMWWARFDHNAPAYVAINTVTFTDWRQALEQTSAPLHVVLAYPCPSEDLTQVATVDMAAALFAGRSDLFELSGQAALARRQFGLP